MSSNHLIDYQGEIIDDKKHGNGTARYADGGTYTGEWKDNKRSGYGVWKNGSVVFSGTWENDQKLNGVWQTDQVYYEGEFWKDKFHGIGTTYKVTSGIERIPVYEGRWIDGERDGKGSEYAFFSEKNFVFKSSEGTWKHGLKHGHFLEYNKPDQLSFEGEYVEGKKHGFGEQYINGKKFFAGNFKESKEHGPGKCFVGVITFEGEYIEGTKAIFYWRQSKTFEGSVERGLPHGYGISYQGGRKTYEGPWRRGKRHGFGTQYVDGTPHCVGMFKDGVFYDGVMKKYTSAYIEEKVVKEGELLQVVLRRFPNGDVFKKKDQYWIGKQTFINREILGAFKEVKNGGLQPAGNVLVHARLNGTTHRIFETYDPNEKQVFDPWKYLQDWAVEEVLQWVQGLPRSRPKFGLFTSSDDKALNKFEKLVVQNQISGYALMKLDSARKLIEAGITNTKVQDSIQQLIQLHKQQMEIINNMMSYFPEVLAASWPVRKLLWVALMKNMPGECPMAVLPRDIVRYICQNFL